MANHLPFRYLELLNPRSLKHLSGHLAALVEGRLWLKVLLGMFAGLGLGLLLGPSAGLYGAIFISFFAALFGGTPTQISGPTAPMTAVSMVISH